MLTRVFICSSTFVSLICLGLGCSGDSDSGTVHYRGVIEDASVNPVFVRFGLSVGDDVSGRGEMHEKGQAVRRGEIRGSVSSQDKFGNKQIEFYLEDSLGETIRFNASYNDEQIRGTYSTGESVLLSQAGTFVASAYAQGAVGTELNRMHLRKTLDDDGYAPFANAAAAQSPDIIPNGLLVIEDPLSLANDAAYGRDDGKSISLNEPNYIYTRAKNLSPSSAMGRLYLYYARGGLVLTPDRWMNNSIRTASGNDYVELNAPSGGVAVSSEPFSFIPPAVSGDLSLIARLSTSDDPNPVPAGVESVDDYMTWVEDSEVAFRTIVNVSRSVPVVSKTFSIGNPGYASRQFEFGINTSGISVGSAVGFSASTALPNGYIYLPKTTVTQSNFRASITVTVPSNYNSELTVTIWSNGERFPSGAEVVVGQYIVIGAATETQGSGRTPVVDKISPLGEATIRFVDN